MRLLAVGLLIAAPALPADLLVAAASDLAPLTASLQPAEARVVGVPVRFSLASSGSLTQQIEHGAPFDVFLSAGENYIQDLLKKGLLDPATVVNYADGRVALWSKSGAIKSLDQLKDPKVLHIAIPNPEHAPYGIAARQVLEKAALWPAVQTKIVYGENVRQALEFAESGNADAVITSWTLLSGRGVLLPSSLHQPIRQTGAVLKSSTQAEAARRFLKFLGSPDGRKILSAGGLFPP